MSKRSFKTIRVIMSIVDIYPLLEWMKDSGMPFLCKLSTQNIWTHSTRSVEFFKRFSGDRKELYRQSRVFNGVERPLKVDLKVLRERDWPLLSLHLRLSCFRTQRVSRGKLAYPVSKKASKISYW